MKVKRCRTLSGLQKAISRGEHVILRVYAGNAPGSTPGAWAISEGRITLNLGGGRYAICSKREYDCIKGHLEILQF